MEAWSEKTEMDCREFERVIPDFIARTMDYPALKSFLAHIRQCKDCKEELIIQFLVREGIQRLEDGNAFDLQAELEQSLEEARKRVKLHDVFMAAGFVTEVIAVLLLAGFMIWMLL